MTAPGILTRGLTRRFDGEVAVDDLDIEVRAGEIHAVVGLNGAGKTTLMRLILGMLRPDAGQALVLGHDTRSAPAELWTRVGHLIESPFAYPELTVTENLTAAALLHGVEKSRIGSAVDQAVDRFQLSEWAPQRARALSLGNRQRLGLASALIHQPQVLVLDGAGQHPRPSRGGVHPRPVALERRDRSWHPRLQPPPR